eukprot:m.90758 g.90758  ORF g.90758 m.90758 type:complete len:142 (+) comp15018_c0_seq1:193-618(+)
MSLQPPPSVVPGAGAGRAQVPLEPGHSMMDWMRLSQRKGSALAGCRPHRVTPEELAAHADPRQGDVWMALAGKVYNISPYLKFHPGGVDELLRGTGIDASKLFCEVRDPRKVCEVCVAFGALRTVGRPAISICGRTTCACV